MVITTTSSSSSTSSTHETQLAAAKLPISNERGEVVEMSVTLSNPNYFEACLLRLASAPIKWRAGYVKSLHTVSMPVDTKVNPGERRRGTIASAATMQSQRWHVRSVVTNEPCARFNAQFELHTSEINLLYPRSLSPQVHAPTPRKIYHKYLSPTLSCCCLLRGHLEACKFGSEWWCGRQLYLYWLPEHPHSRISFLNIGSSIFLSLYLSTSLSTDAATEPAHTSKHSISYATNTYKWQSPKHTYKQKNDTYSQVQFEPMVFLLHV